MALRHHSHSHVLHFVQNPLRSGRHLRTADAREFFAALRTRFAVGGTYVPPTLANSSLRSEPASHFTAVDLDAGGSDDHHRLAEACDVAVDVADELLEVAGDAAQNDFILGDGAEVQE